LLQGSDESGSATSTVALRCAGSVHEESTVLDADDTSNSDVSPDRAGDTGADAAPTGSAPTGSAPAKKAAKKATAKKTAAKKTAKKATKKAAASAPADGGDGQDGADGPAAVAADAPSKKSAKKAAEAPGAPMVLFQAPEKTAAPPRKRAAKATAEAAPADAGDATAADETADHTDGEAPVKKAAKKTAKKAAKKTAAKKSAKKTAEKAAESPEEEPTDEPQESTAEGDEAESGEGGARRRRRRGGRRRRRGSSEDGSDADGSDDKAADSDDDSGEESGSRRRRTRVRAPRNPEDEITGVSGSTRLEAKKQRRREGREAGRRRAPIVSEAEFLARRESVERVMVIRQRGDLTQIGVLEDKVLVEHYVARESQTSLIGNIYLGRVQNVLPSMEAAFVDIGKGRNAVLYAGEVNWSALGHKDGQPRKIESVLQSGQTILVQVTKDPIGHKGARLTGQISLPGRFLVYVPDGTTSGISRKLPDTERNRLKSLLKEIVPDTAGVIVRTAAEGASEDELTRDVERLTARWADIEKKVEAGKAPELLYGEPDLTLKVVRDLFTEDFAKLVVEGDDAWDLVDGYVSHVAPDLRDRLERFASSNGKDVFAEYRVDEQIAKGLDRKVWLPSGGSLVIDRTEAMTVVDVNTGKFTGSGGNLEETVTKNNLEAAEEIVRQLRLRDIGGIIVVDFIDMVLESNRDLVLRRLVECLGRDRTRHQVAEVTSLGLVQMTRKRIGTGLLEAFSEECEHCKGRGVVIHDHPVESGRGPAADEGRGRRGRGGGGRGRGRGGADTPAEPAKPSPMALAGTKPHPEPVVEADESADAATDENPDETTGTTPDAPTGASSDASIEVTWAGVVRPDESAEDVEAARADGASDAPDEPAETADAGSQAAEAPAPIVVTSTRRRRAGRPAGPPAAASGDTADEPLPTAGGDELEPAQVEPAQAESEGDGHVPHVPIKKKGSRKR
jgi:ribonuclease E